MMKVIIYFEFQLNYFILFKINDNISLNNIIRNHNIADVDSSIIKSACNLCTNTPPNFFLIDLKTGNLKERFRMNFLNFLDLKAEGFIEPKALKN